MEIHHSTSLPNIAGTATASSAVIQLASASKARSRRRNGASIGAPVNLNRLIVLLFVWAASLLFATCAHAQNVELACPAGTSPVNGHVTLDQRTQAQRQWACVNLITGQVTIQPDNIINGGYPYPVIVVDGTKITTVAQALALLPNSPVTNTPAGTIDARGCAASSLNLGTYDPGSGGVTLLLGACNYGVDSIVEEPGEQIIGEGDYQNATNVIYNSTAPDNAAIIVPNSAGNDISNLVYTNFLLATFTGTNIGCMVVGPIPANNSSVVATITKMSFFNESPDAAAPCIILNGQGIVAGEQSINAFNITNNEFQWAGNRNASAPILTISGTSSGIVYQGNYGGNEVTGGGPAIVCTDAPTPTAPPAGILIDGNSFLFAAQPVSNTGCLGMSILGNEYNGSNALPDMSDGFPIATYTGATTPGHIATWNATGILQDGGASPSSSIVFQCSQPVGVTSATGVTTPQDLQACASAIPANTLGTVGRTIRIDASGDYASSSTPPQINFTVNLCTVAGCATGSVVHLCSGPLATAAGSAADSNWELHCNAIISVTGASGTFASSGEQVIDPNTALGVPDNVYGFNTIVPGGINTTQAYFVQVTVTFNLGVVANSGTENLLAVAVSN